MIQQSFTTVAGREYVVSFASQPHPGATGSVVPGSQEMTVRVVGATTVLSETVTQRQTRDEGDWSHAADDWTDVSYTFTADSTLSTLSFESTTEGCGCLMLDDIDVSPLNGPGKGKGKNKGKGMGGGASGSTSTAMFSGSTGTSSTLVASAMVGVVVLIGGILVARRRLGPKTNMDVDEESDTPARDVQVPSTTDNEAFAF